MNLTELMERLASFPERSISFYDAEGRVARRTYPEVHADAQRVVAQLSGWGVRAGMRVGILATNSYEFVLYDLALMQLRCTSLAFPDEFGNRDGASLVEDYGLSLLLLSQEDAWPRLSRGEWTAYIDAENPPGTRARDAAPDGGEDYWPALIFSSGTSGKIKGMVIDARGSEETTAKFHALFNIDAGDSLLVFLPLSSYQQRLMIYAAFYYGFDLYLVKPAQLFTAFKDFRPTLCLAPPLLYETIHGQFTKAVEGLGVARRGLLRTLGALARVAPAESVRRRLRQVCYGRIHESLGGRIRVMWTGMAPIKRSTLDFFSTIGVPLFEAYALTECGVIASNSPGQNRLGSVGKPVDEGSVCLAEDGEIIVRKEHVATRGYVYYEEGDGERTYLDRHTVATGDIGRFDEDGYLYLLGRKKEIIVTAQGYKVHPESLEGKLNVCPGVGRSVVFGNGLPYLMAVVSLQQADDPRVRERVERHVEQLNRGLPAIGRINKTHITAEQFTADNGLLTRNLKLNRRAIFQRFERELLGAGQSASAARPRDDAPLNETERALADIWRDVLKVGSVRRSDDFLDLGGDSLVATQVLSRVRDQLGVNLPLADLFEARRLGELALRLDDIRRAEPVKAVRPVARAPRGDELPLSFAQQRLWFLQQLEPDSHSYNEIAAVRLTGALDAAALGRCFSTIAERHEVLRTSFEATDGRPAQVIHPPEDFPLRLVDLQGRDAAGRDAEVQRHAEALVREPFDLTRRPLMRALLLRFGPSEHALLLVMHHIISDGWSMGVLIQEAAALYEVYSSGRQSPLPELEIQYADYAVWQREWLSGDVLQPQLEFWKRRLAGVAPVLELPTDRPRPALQTTRGAHEPVRLTRELTTRLEALGQREGASLFMTLLAALAALLYRYTGQGDICVGTPVANRSRPELERLIGFFVNTLVLRVDSEGDPIFLELLARVKATALESFEHQDVPFEKLVEELPLERRLSHSPLFQVMFALQNAIREELTLPGLKLQLVDVETGTAKFDLLLNLTRTAEGLSGSLEYNTDLFEAETAKRMAEHFRVLLEDVAADPLRRLSRLTLLAEEERRRTLVEWNDTAADYPRAACVHELFAAQAAGMPEAVALVHGDERMTYGELDRRADLLARHLRRRGVGPESRVGVCVGRSPEMIVAVLAALKAGGAYVPLDPTYPPERLSFMLEDSGASLLLTQERFADALPTAPVERVLLDADWESVSPEGEADSPSAGVLQENVAYVLYTSGSTGRPKGVAMCHGALANLISWQLQQSNLPARARTLQFASLNFDVSFQEIFATLCAGGALVLVDEPTRRDPSALLRHLRDERVERLFLPFVALQQLAEAASGMVRPSLALREVITAGEQLHVTPAISELFARMEGCTLHNQYGPTESHVVTAHTLEGEAAGWETLPPIGVPIANVQIYLFDPHLQPVPVGVAGELYIGGDALARGYLGRPALTAERFVPSPFGPEPGARLYRTGDSARHLKDGRIEYLGRLDFQLKVRGFRVEPEEVEAALARHRGVRACAVAARDDAAGGKRLVAYVVAKESATPTAGELREFLRGSMPEYMIPSAFTFLDALPLTPSGKVNRRALPEPDQSRPESAVGYVAPRTPEEETLARIWAELLRVGRVGIHDSFFDLGGHSLLATQVISRVNTAFQMEVPLGRIFEADTVARLAEVIHEQKAAREAEAERIAQLLAQVKALSPEELRAMLQEKT